MKRGAGEGGQGLKYMDCEWATNQESGKGPCDEMELITNPVNPGPRVIEYKMRDSDGFYDALFEEYGVEADWVRWTDYAINDECSCPPPPVVCPDCRSVSGRLIPPARG
jgi:chitinase